MNRTRAARWLFAVLIGCGIASFAHALAPHEPGAFLVFPNVQAENSGGVLIETFVTITNTSLQSVIAHVSLINGDGTAPQYCFECDFDVPLAGLDTESLVFSRPGAFTSILNVDTGASRACSARIGFVTVDVEDFNHNALTDNVLIGEEVVVNYTAGTSESLGAIAIQGFVGDGDRNFRFDGAEYEKLPAYVMGGFLAPDFAGPVDAELILLTLGFGRQAPPDVDCAISGVDAFARAFTTGTSFGCWARIGLETIDPELSYPYLGVGFGSQEHGWMKLRCTTRGTGLNPSPATGGVLGVIVQRAAPGSVLRRVPAGPTLVSTVAWARMLQMSPFTGDSVVLTLEAAQGGGFDLRHPPPPRGGAAVISHE